MTVPNVMRVYHHLAPIGEIEDHKIEVRAWRGTGEAREFIGAYGTRREAIAAVEAAAAAG